MGCWTYGGHVGVSRWSLPSPFGEGLGVRLLLAVRFCVIGWLKCLCEPCGILFFCVVLWEKEHCMCVWIGFSLTEHTEFTEPFGAQIESTERLGIQRTQSVSAIVDTNKGHNDAYIHSIGVSRWLLPFSGWGEGGGATIFYELVCSVLLCNSVRKRNVLCEKKKCPRGKRNCPLWGKRR